MPRLPRVGDDIPALGTEPVRELRRQDLLPAGVDRPDLSQVRNSIRNPVRAVGRDATLAIDH